MRLDTRYYRWYLRWGWVYAFAPLAVAWLIVWLWT